jgi:hypothetical protein
MKTYTMEEAEIIIEELKRQAREDKNSVIVFDDKNKQNMARESTRIEPALWCLLQGFTSQYDLFDEILKNHKP